ncbi:MAG: hypothetical protein MJY58_01900, partial [Bacteroidaceae bacterium]|nr:hypothetical protein [Bacteroidaceae bacterium]
VSEYACFTHGPAIFQTAVSEYACFTHGPAIFQTAVNEYACFTYESVMLHVSIPILFRANPIYAFPH